MEPIVLHKAKPAVITVTETALARLKALSEKNPGHVLKIGIKKGGCAGMEYTLDWARELSPLDEIIEQEGIKVAIDGKAILFLLGCQMDYTVEKFKSGFVFHNPNQISACGCGESVELKPANQGDE